MKIGGHDIITDRIFTPDVVHVFIDKLKTLWPELIVKQEGNEFFIFKNEAAKDIDDPKSDLLHILLGEETTFVVARPYCPVALFVYAYLDLTVPTPGWWWIRKGATLLGTVKVWETAGELFMNVPNSTGVDYVEKFLGEFVAPVEPPPLEVPEAAQIYMVTGDLTKMPMADAIVNAANEQLKGGHGVCGAVFKAAGWGDMQASCNEYPERWGDVRCQTGFAVVTEAHALPNKGVIHAVGPVYSENRRRACKEELHNAYYNSIKLADECGYKTIAFPAISCGIFKYPLEEAAQVALEGVVEGLRNFPSVKRVEFVFLPFGDGPEVQAVFEDAFEAIQ